MAVAFFAADFWAVFGAVFADVLVAGFWAVLPVLRPVLLFVAVFAGLAAGVVVAVFFGVAGFAAEPFALLFTAREDDARVTVAVTLFAAAAVLPASFCAVERAIAGKAPLESRNVWQPPHACGEDMPPPGRRQPNARTNR